jgi:hypothetical protein
MKSIIKIVIFIGFIAISGCAVYTPAPYGYGMAPVVPMPVFGFGFRGRR